jgi:uncharacterized protein YodC (DUF2158 family)
MSQSSQFTIGNIVKLKSGGPEMTVAEERNYSGVSVMMRCQWFDGKKLEQGEFPSNSLELVKPVPKVP